jgi:hypothetical protein
MARKRPPKQTTVLVEQASIVELTKRGSKNSLLIKVRRGKDLLGTLILGKGSVQWWPDGNEVNSLKKSWKSFAELLEREMRK